MFDDCCGISSLLMLGLHLLILRVLSERRGVAAMQKNGFQSHLTIELRPSIYLFLATSEFLVGTQH